MRGTCEVCGLESITDGGSAVPRGEVSCPRCRTRYAITPSGLRPLTPRAVLQLRAARLGGTPPAWSAAIAAPRAPRHATLGAPLSGARAEHREPLDAAAIDGPDLAPGRTPARYASGIAFALGILAGVIGSSSTARSWLAPDRSEASIAAPSVREPVSNALADGATPAAAAAAFDRTEPAAAPGAPAPPPAASEPESERVERTMTSAARAAIAASPGVAPPALAAPTMAAAPPSDPRAAAAAPARDPAADDGAPEPSADPQAAAPSEATVPASSPSTLAGALARAVGAPASAATAPPGATASPTPAPSVTPPAAATTAASAPSDPATDPPHDPGPPAFDASAAAGALRRAAGALAGCEAAPEQKGRAGRVSVTFLPSGAVSRVLVEGVAAGTDAGSCVARAFRTASVPAFTGAPVVVHQAFVLR